MASENVVLNTQKVIASGELNDFDEIGDLDTVKEKVEAAQSWLLLCLFRAGVAETQITATAATQLRSLVAYDLLWRYFAEVAREMSTEEGFASKREHWKSMRDEEKEDIFGTDPPALTLTPGTTDKPGGEMRQIQIGG